jgi:transketolase
MVTVPAVPIAGITTTMRERAAAVACDLFRDDPRVAIVLAAISRLLFEPAMELDPRRSVNLGIMEQSMIGVAAGFAMEGFHPIAHSITPFLVERPYEQLKDDFALQGLGGTFISVGASYDYSAEGGTHHAPGDVGALLQIPGFEVLVPGHPDELERLLRATYANGRPTYLRASSAVNDRAMDVEPGRMAVVRRGVDATVVAVGPLLDRTLRAVSDLDVTVLYASSIEPFDARTLASVVGARPLVITVEPWYRGTTTATIVDALSGVPSRVVSIGVPKRFPTAYGTPAEHDVANGLDERGIRRQVDHALAGGADLGSFAV